MRKLWFLIIVMWIAPSSIVVSESKARENDFQQIFDRYLELCIEYSLPNSMARPPGFDINAHLEQIKQEKDNVAGQLSTEKGLEYVRYRLESITDDLERSCATELIRTRKEGPK